MEELSMSKRSAHFTGKGKPVVNKMFEIINHTNPFVFAVVTLVFYCLGIVVNYYVPFPQFVLFHSLFTGVFIIAFFAVRYFERQMEELHHRMADSNFLILINNKTSDWRRSNLNLLIPPLAGAFFGILALLSVNVDMTTASGVYLILSYAACVLLSFLGYLQYVYLFLYVQDLSNCIDLGFVDDKYSSGWVDSLKKLCNNFRFVFFALGVTYVFMAVYFVICGDYMVWEKVASSDLYAIPLWLLWVGVFYAIVVAFSITSIMEQRCLKKIVDKFKR